MSAFELKLSASEITRRRDDWRRFSLWLPLFSSMVWLAMVAKPILYSFIMLLPSRGIGPSSGRTLYVFLMAVHYGSSEYANWIQGVNVPGLLGEVITSLPTSWPESWHPEAMPLEDWRALVWPFFCMPFWWFAGYGIEGFLRMRTLRWPSLTLGTVLTVFFAILAVMFIGESFGKHDENFVWAPCGVALWTLLFAAFPVSWVHNRRSKAVIA